MPLTADHHLLEPLELRLPHLPAELEGLRLVHLSDLHVRRPRRRHRAIARALDQVEADLVLFTGDYIQWKGDELAAYAVMADLCRHARARLGMLGVFGNHDTEPMRRMLADLPVRWLEDQTWQAPGLPLWVAGAGAHTGHDRFGDSLALLQAIEHLKPSPTAGNAPPRPLRVFLSHFPMYLPTAADLGMDLVLSGHTHGGQCRLPTGQSLMNSSDLPLRLTTGLLRHRDTLCAVSRGLGESMLPLRLFCRPHIPVYTLRRGPLPGRSTVGVDVLHRW